jgi:hypothetical protein
LGLQVLLGLGLQVLGIGLGLQVLLGLGLQGLGIGLGLQGLLAGGQPLRMPSARGRRLSWG